MTNKYHARRTTIDGYQFDSLAEAARYQELLTLVRAGEITGLRVHPRYCLQEGFTTADGERVRPVYYEGDFEYSENGRTVCEDIKGGHGGSRAGTRTDTYQLKRKLFIYRYPDIQHREVEA